MWAVGAVLGKDSEAMLSLGDAQLSQGAHNMVMKWVKEWVCVFLKYAPIVIVGNNLSEFKSKKKKKKGRRREGGGGRGAGEEGNRRRRGRRDFRESMKRSTTKPVER